MADRIRYDGGDKIKYYCRACSVPLGLPFVYGDVINERGIKECARCGYNGDLDMVSAETYFKSLEKCNKS